jgi:hypothetical protein
MALIAAVAVIVIVAGYLGIAVAAKLPPFKGSATPTPVAACPSGEQLRSGQCTRTTPTPSPTSTPTASASPTPSPTASSSLTPLAKILPSYITGDSSSSCSSEPTGAYVATNETSEELCNLSADLSVPEDYVLYVGFPTASPATSYFGSLLSSNGMKASQGDCSSLNLVTASDSTSQYCEDTYTTSGSSGSDFVFSGSPTFDLGNSNPVSGLDMCAGATTVDVVGFTDPTYTAVGIAIGCTGASDGDQLINSDFTAGDLFLGS